MDQKTKTLLISKFHRTATKTFQFLALIELAVNKPFHSVFKDALESLRESSNKISHKFKLRLTSFSKLRSHFVAEQE